MASQVVLFAEEDTMFRLMETALNGVASPQAERALHYFFGESIAEPLSRLTELPGILGLPPGIRGVLCDDEAKLADYIGEADYLVAESARVTRDLIRLGQGRLRLIGQVQGRPLQPSARTSVTAKCKHLLYSNMVENTSWR